MGGYHPEDHSLRWFAYWLPMPGGGFDKEYETHKDALAARTPGTNEPADVIVCSTRAELRKLADWNRTFR